MIFNLTKKGILDFHVTTATDIFIKEVIDSSLSTLKENHGSTKSINFSYHCTNLASKGLPFYYTAILQVRRYRTGLYDISNF